MEIRDVELSAVRIERADGGAPVQSLLIAVTSSSGAVGWGETRLAWRLGELHARREALLAVLGGRSIFDTAELSALESLDQPSIRLAVEMALWDLIGKTTGQPLCNLWGGAYRRHIPLAVKLPAGGRIQPADLARELADRGFHHLIWPATGSVADDLASVGSILDAVGDRVELAIDGAGKFTADDGYPFSFGLPDWDVRYVLDPLAASDDLTELSELAHRTLVPLAVSRQVEGVQDILPLRGAGVTFVVLDPRRVGGLLPTLRCGTVCSAASMLAAIDVAGSCGLLTAAMLQIAACAPSLELEHVCDYGQLVDDVLTRPLEIFGGAATLPPLAGLGVDVSRAKVEQYQIG